ncbi:ATP-binding protein [Duganella sp. HH105]|uniref:ATP-binding protein n=1 Tax=Duganella sp. HH105 TaxID=1781067 RepID=UPI000877C2B3|nr:ATP-binding protein [Duganella sp. HH105]OEZ60751.1 sensor protein ZraS [Duganella sp. HH105]
MMQPSPSDQPGIVLLATNTNYDLATLRIMLAPHGLQVEQVRRGDEALALAAGGRVVMALLDVTLAGSARLELCQRIHAGGALPVFLLSGAPTADEHERAFEAGACAYLPLSFPSEDVAEKILLQLQRIAPAPVSDLPTMATLEVNYHHMLSGSPDAILLMQRGSNRVLDVNRRTRTLFGMTETELIQTDLPALCPPLQPDGRPSAAVFAAYVEQVMAGDVQVFELAVLHSSGRQVACELRMVPLTTPEHRLMHVRIVDVSSRKLAEQLRDGKNQVLEMIARGDPLNDTLERLTLLIESQAPPVLCTVMLVAPDGVTLQTAAGPSLPADYLAAINGLPAGPVGGSCGTAIHRRETVVVSDILNDPLWAPYRDIALRYGLRACWAMPILLDQGTVLGSFAMYYREPRSPTEDDRRLIKAATHLAGIAIASTRREAELVRHREHLEELVHARTAELQHAKEEAEHANEELTTALDNLSQTQEELVRRDKLAALGALVAGVAHELNTPIGNCLTMAGSMAERTAGLQRDMEGGLRRSVLESYLQQAADADQVVLRNLNRAAALVASFRRIAVDSASSPRSRFVLGDLVAQLLQATQATVQQRGLELVEEIEHWIELDSYPGPLAQALENLIDNCILHGFDGRDGGSIMIRAQDAGNGEIAITVADDGVGIPAANLARIYDPFFTTRLGAGGSGLGLYITHNIVTGVLGGRIEAVSTPGLGSSFTMRLPRVAPL